MYGSNRPLLYLLRFCVSAVLLLLRTGGGEGSWKGWPIPGTQAALVIKRSANYVPGLFVRVDLWAIFRRINVRIHF